MSRYLVATLHEWNLEEVDCFKSVKTESNPYVHRCTFRYHLLIRKEKEIE